MKYYIILSPSSVFKGHLQALYQPQQYKLILISGLPWNKKNFYRDISQLTSPYFSAIHQLAEFNLATVGALIKSYIDKVGAHNLYLLTDDEMGVLLSAQLREIFNLFGPRCPQILPFIDKVIMKSYLQQANIRLPRYKSFNLADYRRNPVMYIEQQVDYLGLPILVKPLRGAGSLGNHKFVDKTTFAAWCSEQDAKNLSIAYELDEFIDGKLYHCDSLIQDGKILLSQVCEYSYPNMDFISHSRILSSINLLDNDSLKQELLAFNQKVLAALPVPNGATHMEIFRKQNGELIFLEIGARTPGGLISLAYEKATGVSWALEHFRLQMQLPLKYLLPTQHRFTCGWFFVPRAEEAIIQVKKLHWQSHSQEIRWHVELDQQLTSSQSLLDVAVEGFFWDEDYQHVLHDFYSLR
ncbi:hypothetical protein BH10PSE19_BH10PSE19_10700 [soil metagenome]